MLGTNAGSFGALEGAPGATELIEAFIAGVTGLNHLQRADVLRAARQDQPGSSFAEITSGATVALVLREVLSVQQFDLLYRGFNRVLPAEELVAEARLRAFLTAIDQPKPARRGALTAVKNTPARGID